MSWRPRWWSRESWPAAAAIAACVLPALWFLPMLWRGEMLWGVDFNVLWVHNHDFLGRALGEGRWPLWNPHYHCGMPFLAGYQTNVCYPPAWIAIWLKPTAALVILIAGHLACAAVGTWWCARQLGAPHFAAVIAAWAVGWSTYVLSHTYGGHLPVVQVWAWIPWVYGYAAWLRTDQRPRVVVGLAVMVALMLLAGSAQIAWIALVGLGIAALAWAWRRTRAEWQRPAIAAGLALAAGGCWAAPAVLPAAALARESPRAAGMPDGWYSEYTLHAGNLALWVTPEIRGLPEPPFPDYDADGRMLPRPAARPRPWNLNTAGFWWEEAGHVGLVPLFLAMIALAVPGRRRWAFGGIALAGFLAALLAAPAIEHLGGFGRFLAWPVTAFGRFRAPLRYLALPTLAFALLAAEGLRIWCAAEAPEALRLAKRAALATAGLVLVLLLPMAWQWWDPPAPPPGMRPQDAEIPVRWSALWWALLPAATAVGAATAVLVRRRYPAGAALLCCAGTLAGLAPTFGLALRPFPRQVSDPMFTARGVPKLLLQGVGQGRVIRSQQNVTQNSGLTTGLEQVEGFDPLITAHWNRVIDRLIGSPPTPSRIQVESTMLGGSTLNPVGARWLDILNARWIWEGNPFRMGQSAPGEERVARRVLERTTARPRSWCVTATQPLGPAAPGAAPDAVLRAVEDPAFDPATMAVVEAADASAPPSAVTLPGRVDILGVDVPEHVRLRVHIDAVGSPAASHGYCVHSVPWSAGWRVHIDDGPALRPDRVDGVIMGIAVPPGAHDVEWRYHAPGLAAGLWLAFLAALGAVVACVVLRRRDRATA